MAASDTHGCSAQVRSEGPAAAPARLGHAVSLLVHLRQHCRDVLGLLLQQLRELIVLHLERLLDVRDELVFGLDDGVARLALLLNLLP
jgi:hypothetical protein